jgi:hypothetical protein
LQGSYLLEGFVLILLGKACEIYEYFASTIENSGPLLADFSDSLFYSEAQE